MAERRSARRQSFPTPEQGVVCGLCNNTSGRTSKYPSWKDKQSQQYIQSMGGIDEHSPICRACRDDVSRVVRNPAFTPRWKKEEKKDECIILTCNNSEDIHYSHTISCIRT